jgi:hypothetical protein
MKVAVIAVVSLMTMALPGLAMGKSCDELKTEIETRIQSKKVTRFKLDVIPAGEPAAGKVVGSCEGGKKQIIYTRS